MSSRTDKVLLSCCGVVVIYCNISNDIYITKQYSFFKKIYYKVSIKFELCILKKSL